MLFWPFLGGFCWVIGDLFQQYAAKYIGIGRGIPLSNTNQLWGLAWGALVFGEMAGLSSSGKVLIFAGSGIMILGAVAISMADPGDSELVNWKFAMDRECDRYSLNTEQVAAVVAGDDPHAGKAHQRRWWEMLIMCSAVGVFVWLALGTQAQSIAINVPWAIFLVLLHHCVPGDWWHSALAANPVLLATRDKPAAISGLNMKGAIRDCRWRLSFFREVSMVRCANRTSAIKYHLEVHSLQKFEDQFHP